MTTDHLAQIARPKGHGEAAKGRYASTCIFHTLHHMTLDSTSTRLIAQELQLLSSERRSPLLFHGKTMLPFLIDGDQLVVEPVKFDELKRGDIVVYKYHDHFPARRVLRVCKSRKCVTVNGDNLPAAMEFDIGPSDVLGVVVTRERENLVLDSSAGEWKHAARRAVRRAWLARVLAPFTP